MAEDKKTLTAEQGNSIRLVSKYDRWYIRFMGGNGEDEVCDLPISIDDARMLRQGKAEILQIKEKYEQRYKWSLEDYIDNTIADEMRYTYNCSVKEIKENLAILNRHKGIKMECYDVIIEHRFPVYNYVTVQGRSAQWIYENLNLSVLATYLCMSIFLYRSGKGLGLIPVDRRAKRS